MTTRAAAVALVALACLVLLGGTALASDVPINPFGRPGDLHVDFPTYAAQQDPNNGGMNNDPPEAMLRRVGDVNGDGRSDLAMGISSANASWTTAVWVTFTPAVLPATVNAGDPDWQGLKIVGAGSLISGIDGVGDVNGDGFGDVAVSAAGKGAWVVFGGPAPGTVDVANLGSRGFSITGLQSCYPPGGGNLWTGVFSRNSAVLGVGDQNGDGRPDLAVCTYGPIYVIYTPAQPAGAVVDALHLGSGVAALTPPAGLQPYPLIDSVGDTSGDGRPDLAIGWSQDDGSTHILATPLPAPGMSVSLSDQETSPDAWGFSAANARLERFVAIGDDNGDGRRDLSLSVIENGGRHQMVLYGQPAGSHAPLLPLTAGAGHDIQDIGNGVADAGDQDGDGRSDLAYMASFRLSSTGESVSIDQTLPECVTLKQLSPTSALVLCSLEYNIMGTLPDANQDGKPEFVAIHADPLPVEDGVTRATWRLDVFSSAPAPQPQTLQPPVALPGGGIDFTSTFLTAPPAPTRTLAARASVAVTDGAGQVATAAGGLVDAGAAPSTSATVQSSASQLGLLAGLTYSYRMTLANGRGLSGTTETATFKYTPSVSGLPISQPVRGKRIVGTRRADRIRGTPGPDVLLGRGGNDLVMGLAGDDRIDGGSGRDRLDGGSGKDRITGGPGRDRVRAGRGDDQVFTRDGRADRVDCGAGRDVATVDRRDHVAHCERVRRR